MSIFNNESILAWLKYFAENTPIDLSTVRILDITGEDRNLLPAVQANRSVLVFTDGNRPEVFYSMWDSGMGDCEIWYNEGSEPAGPMKHNLLSEMIDRGSTSRRPCSSTTPGPTPATASAWTTAASPRAPSAMWPRRSGR